MKKVLMVSEPAIGGVARHILDLASSLKEDFQLTIAYSGMICPEFGAKIRGAGATAVRIDMTRNISAMDFKSLASIYLLMLR